MENLTVTVTTRRESSDPDGSVTIAQRRTNEPTYGDTRWRIWTLADGHFALEAIGGRQRVGEMLFPTRAAAIAALHDPEFIDVWHKIARR